MLTNREMDEIYLLMKQDGFGMKRSRMLDYIVQYRQAKENGDRLTLEKIEYHLNYINYRYELGLLMVGQYEKLTQVVENW